MGRAEIVGRLHLDEVRYFNPGTTISIDDGKTREYGLVLRVENDAIVLFDPVANDYDAFNAVVETLARVPVNANTASPLVLEPIEFLIEMTQSEVADEGRRASLVKGLQAVYNPLSFWLMRPLRPAATN